MVRITYDRKISRGRLEGQQKHGGQQKPPVKEALKVILTKKTYLKDL